MTSAHLLHTALCRQGSRTVFNSTDKHTLHRFRSSPSVVMEDDEDEEVKEEEEEEEEGKEELGAQLV